MRKRLVAKIGSSMKTLLTLVDDLMLEDLAGLEGVQASEMADIALRNVATAVYQSQTA